MFKSKLAVLVLAAGLSRRMGMANKLLLPFGGVTLLEATLRHLEEAAVGEQIVVLGHEADLVRPLLHGRACRVVINPAFSTGMTSSIQTGVATAPAGCGGYMVCLADMPLIVPAEYRLVAAAFEEALAADPLAIVQPRYRGERGNPVVFAPAHRDALLALRHPEGARPVVLANSSHLYPVEMPTDATLCDADTPEAYRHLLERITKT